MNVAVVDYGSGNLRSAAKALSRAARESHASANIVVTDDAAVVAAADRVVLPGVGAYADCKRGLEAVDGMTEAVEELVRVRGRPFLGICVGMQLMAERGLEHGETAGFGWMKGDVVRLAGGHDADGHSLKIPHMGWNTLSVDQQHPVLAGIGSGDYAYFVHSYHFKADASAVLATADYGETVTAMVGKDTMVGTQFHPEKSQATGLRLLANFLSWSP